MKRFTILLSVLFTVFLTVGLIGCGEDDEGPSGPTIDSPTNLQAEALSDSKVKLTWESTSDAFSFAVERAPGGAESWDKIVEVGVGTKTYENPGLLEGTRYDYRVKAILEGSVSDYCDPVSILTFPKAPSELEAEVVGSVVNLTWDDESDVEEGFNLERKEVSDNDFKPEATIGSNQTSYQDATVDPDKSYVYRLQATLEDVGSLFTDEVSVLITAVPSGLQVTGVTPSQVTLIWTDNSSAESGYRLERLHADTNWANSVNVNLGANTSTYSDSNDVSEAQFYKYRVRTLYGERESEPSNVVSAVTPLVAPTDLRATKDQYDPTVVTLSWNDNSGAEARYELQRKKEGEEFSGLVDIDPDIETHTDRSPLEDETYTYRIRAAAVVSVDADLVNAYSDWSGKASVTTTGWIPNPPSNLSGEVLTYHSILLSWQDNSDDELGFVIERSASRSGPYTDAGTVSTDQTESTDDGLEANTLYYYRVYAFNDSGRSVATSAIMITTGDAPPTAPVELLAEAFNYTTIDLIWQATSENHDGFYIERALSESGEWGLIGTVTKLVRSYRDQAIEPLTTYYYRIYAFNEVGNSGYSNVAYATTQVAPPEPPSNLRLAEVGEGEVNPSIERVILEWNDNSDTETGFCIYRTIDRWEELVQLGADVVTYTDVDILPETGYAYLIRSFNESGISVWSNQLNIEIPSEPPLAPTLLQAEPIDLTTLRISWRPGSYNEDFYILERRHEEDGEFFPIADVPRAVYQYVDYDLEVDGHTYWYRVKAVNTGGESDWSDIAEGTTPSLVVLNVTFEDYEVGIPPPNEDGWDIQVTGNGWTEVIDSDAHESVQCVAIYDTTAADMIWLWNEFTPIEHGYVSAWLKISPNGYMDFFCTDRQLYYTWQVRFMGDITHTIIARNGRDLLNTNATFTPDEWFHIEVYFDRGTTTYTVLIDDETIIEDWGMQNVDGSARLYMFTFSDVTLPYGYMDDVWLEIVMEEEDGRGPMRNHGGEAPAKIPFENPVVSQLAR